MVRRAGRVVGVEYLRISGGAERYDWPSGAVGVAAVIGDAGNIVAADPQPDRNDQVS